MCCFCLFVFFDRQQKKNRQFNYYFFKPSYFIISLNPLVLFGGHYLHT